jgi:hypothetical protein
MATASKTAPKRAAKKVTPKPKPKPKAAKPKAKAKAKAAKKVQPIRTDARPELASASAVATDLIRVPGPGRKIKGKESTRSPISTQRLGAVADSIGKRDPKVVVRQVMFGGPKFGAKESAKAALDKATEYAGGKVGSPDLPEGAASRIRALAESFEARQKIGGRVYVASLVALATTKRDKVPAKKAAPKKAATK